MFKGYGEFRLNKKTSEELIQMCKDEKIFIPKNFSKKEIIKEMIKFKKNNKNFKNYKDNIDNKDEKKQTFLGLTTDIFLSIFPKKYINKTKDEEINEISKGVKSINIEQKKNNNTITHKRKKPIQAIKNIVCERDQYKCKICNRQLDYRDIEMGHIKSYKHGGKETIENLCVLCGTCNKSIGSKDVDEFIKEQGLKWKL